MGFHGESCSLKPKSCREVCLRQKNPSRDTVAAFRFELTLTRLRIQDLKKKKVKNYKDLTSRNQFLSNGIRLQK